ncbi:hypothetical protein MTO96_035097 [Rhipicephalus appendiculatus]
MATGRRQAEHLRQASSSTLSPSTYERNIDSVTPDDTTTNNNRERTVVLVLSGLLLFISGSLFAILLVLISEDFSVVPTAITLVTGACPKLCCLSLMVLNFFGSWLQQRFVTRTIKQ